ncbi:MAG: transporter substrate-binding domain-containing protein [Clostridia bacterium]|nr:transporter substrate-binding domain-containing protein [Clostridia bacterium]
MRQNPYKIGRTKGISPRLKDKLKQLPTLKGYEGRWFRRVLIGIGVVLAALIAIHFLKPETQLMSSVEIKRIESAGVLTVGVRDDMPGFCENGTGLEAELAKLLAERILPDTEGAVRFVPCSSTTVTTKLKDGSIDVAIALQPNGQGSAYSYSYPYYSDKISLVTLDPANVDKGLGELTIGYIPGTAAGSRFASYAAELGAAPEQGIVDRLLRRPKPTPDPETAIMVETRRFGSIDELLSALKSGAVDAIALPGAYLNKYFNDLAGETDAGQFYICRADVGSVDYCMLCSSDEPALMQLADMLIYELKENGTLERLTKEYLSDLPGR